MTEFPAGYLVFAVSETLTSVHILASELSRLKPDVHLLDVGLISQNAWMAAWFESKELAEEASKEIDANCTAISANAARALVSLGPALSKEAVSIGLLEVSSIEELTVFFNSVSECEKCGWTPLEIRIRKSGPSGAHAFFEKTSNASRPKVAAFSEIAVHGDYRKFF